MKLLEGGNCFNFTVASDYSCEEEGEFGCLGELHVPRGMDFVSE